MFIVLIRFPPIKQGKDADFHQWFRRSNEEFAKQPGFIRRRLIRNAEGGSYAAVVEHESRDTFMAMHHSEPHAEQRKAVDALFDGEPEPVFYEVVVDSD